MTDRATHRAVLEGVSEALALLDPETGTVRDANQRYCDLHDRERSALVGRSFDDLTADHWDPPVPADDLLDRAVDTGSTAFEWRVGDGDGVRVEVTLTAVTFDDPGVLASARRAAERPPRDEELVYQNALLEGLLESTIDGILVVDEDRRIVQYNERFQELWDIDEAVLETASSEVTVEHVLDTVADPEAFRRKVQYLYDNPELESRDEIRFADGRWIDRYTAPVLDDDGTYYGRLWVFRDITQRRERERELRRQNARLEEFTGVVSHDLRGPLSVARGRLELAAEECDSDHLDQVDGALSRMTAIVEDTLTLARQGRRVADPEPVDLAALAEECWTMVDTDDATLRVESSVTVEGDPGRLRHVFENLFQNAVEHGTASPEQPGDDMDQDGASSEDVTVRVGPTDGGFYVADDGPGLPDDADNLFDPGTTTDEDGTGFGLTIARRIAEAHGWEVRAGESDGGGARFEFVDPEEPS